MISGTDQKSNGKYKLENQVFIEIANDALTTSNIYNLNDQEKSDLQIVLNTLDKIKSNIKMLSKKTGNQRDTIFFDDGTQFAPIHLRPIPEGEAGEKVLNEYLLDGFVSAYNKVRNNGPETIKFFCEQLTGNCIDSRTREALAFAGGTLPTTFTKSLEDCENHLNARARKNYFEYFSSLLKTRWGKPFFKDSRNGFSKEAGVFNESPFCLEKIKLYLSNMKKLNPGTGFLDTLQTLTENEKPIFLRFVLSHPQLLDTMQIKEYTSYKSNNDYKHITRQSLSAANLPDEKSNSTITSAIENTISFFNRSLLTINWDKLILSDEDYPMARTLLSRAYPETCFQILITYNFCKNLSAAKQSDLMQMYIDTLNYCKKYDSDIFAELRDKKDKNDDSMIHMAAKLNFSIQFIALASTHPTSLTHKNKDDKDAIELSLENYNPKILEWLADHKTNFKNYDMEDSLTSAASGNDEKLLLKLINANADLNTTVHVNEGILANEDTDILSIAVIKNNVTLLEKILPHWKPDKRRVSPLIYAIKYDSTKPDTLKWLLKHKQFDVNTTYQGKSALAIALEDGNENATQLISDNHEVNLTPILNAIKDFSTLNNPEKLLPILTNTNLQIRTIKQKLPINTDAATTLLIRIYKDIGPSIFIDYPLREIFADEKRPLETAKTLSYLFERIYPLLLKKSDSLTLSHFFETMLILDPTLVNNRFYDRNKFETLSHMAIILKIPHWLRIFNENKANFNHLNSDKESVLTLAAKEKAWDTVNLILQLKPLSNLTFDSLSKTLKLAIEDQKSTTIIPILKWFNKNEIYLSNDEITQLKKMDNNEINKLLIPYRLNSVIKELHSSSCCYYAFFSKHSRRALLSGAQQLYKVQNDDKANLEELGNNNAAIKEGELGEIYQTMLKLQ